MDISTFRDLVGETAWAHGKQLVRSAYPDPKCTFGDGLIARVICSLPPEARAAIGAAKVTTAIVEDVLGAALEAVASADDGPATYFIAEATHTRHGAGAHQFVGRLPVVRVELPATGQINRSTEFGIVYAGDNKLHSVALLTKKYRDVLDFDVGRAFVTTAARYLGARFAAISVYEVFDTAGAMRCWVLEAGMATGEAMMLFYSPSGGTIVRRAQYVPTPFSDGQHWYRGSAEFNMVGPTNVRVDVCTNEELLAKAPHVTVDVTYQLQTGARIFPSKLTAQAGLRVAAIAVARGTDNPLFHLLAPFANALDWEKKP